MGCLTACSPTLVPLGEAGCNPTFMNGGYYKIAFMKCDKDFDDTPSGSITDVTRWQEMIDDNDIVISNEILGSKGASSTTKLRVASCKPEVVTGGTTPYSFEDFNADTDEFTHITWWKQIQSQYNTLKVMFITCEGYVYGPIENGTWSIEVSEVRENTKESPAKIAGTITVSDYALIVPVKVPGLIGLI